MALQIVKELRTDYSGAVASSSGRLSAALQLHPATSIKVALYQPMEGGQREHQSTQQQVRALVHIATPAYDNSIHVT